VVDLSFSLRSGCAIVNLIGVLGVLQLFVKAKAESVFSFVTNREVREDEVASRLRAVQVNHSGNRSARQDGQSGRVIVGNASLSDRTGLFKSGEEKVVCIDSKGNVVLGLFAFVDAKFDNRRRVDRAAVSGG
jgi:hypothetical protein